MVWYGDIYIGDTNHQYCYSILQQWFCPNMDKINTPKRTILLAKNVMNQWMEWGTPCSDIPIHHGSEGHHSSSLLESRDSLYKLLSFSWFCWSQLPSWSFNWQKSEQKKKRSTRLATATVSGEGQPGRLELNSASTLTEILRRLEPKRGYKLWTTK